MNKELFELIALLRILIGYLGEKNQYAWWDSNFLSTSSKAYLAYSFPKTTMLAQYNGVNEAALLVHDKYIGVGHNFHLFRLPVALEENVENIIKSGKLDEQLLDSISSPQVAEQRLVQLREATRGDFVEGPVGIGNYDDNNLADYLYHMANRYSYAFKHHQKTYPFLREVNV